MTTVSLSFGSICVVGDLRQIIFQQMQEQKATVKSLDARIKECKQVIVQNVEKTLQNKMVYMFLKEKKRDTDVKTLSVNTKDGYIKMQFADHEKAAAFYQEFNFQERILIRPFNIYFNLALQENQMKKYYLEGITEENQRKLFEAANRIGICKLYTSYGNAIRAKLKSTGLISFIRKENIPEPEFKRLESELKDLGIKITPYVHEKGTMKVSLNLLDFLSDDLVNQDESLFQELAEKEATNIIKKYAGDISYDHLSVITKKRETPEAKAGEEKKGDSKTKIACSALFEFDNAAQTFEIFEKIRIGLKDEPLGKVRLFFHNEENNSFLSLFTAGLAKPEDRTVKQFEDDLIQAFRGINKDVIQVNVFPMRINDSYVGRVYLKSEEEGKSFIVDYANHRSKIYKYYKEGGQAVVFNITIDNKTLKKIRAAEKRARDTENKIKNTGDITRQNGAKSNPINRPLPAGAGFPIFPPGPLMGPAMPGMGLPGMPGIPGGMGVPTGMPGVPGLPGIPGGMPPRLGEMPMGGFGKGMPMGGQMGGPKAPQNPRVRIGMLLRDRERLLSMDENTAKRNLVDPLVGLAEEINVKTTDALRVTNMLMKEKSVAEIYTYLQNPTSYFDALRSNLQI